MSSKELEKKLPAGCDRKKLEETVEGAMKEVGAASLTMKILLRKCEAEYGQNFKEFKPLLDDIIVSRLGNPTAQKEMKTALKAAEAAKTAGGVGKKRGSKASKDEAPMKKQKREKQEGEPKRAQTAFFAFSNEKRPEVTKRLFPGEGEKIKVAEVAAEIGKLWAQLDEEGKKPYEAIAAKDKERFDKEVEEFIAKGGTMSGKAKKEKPEGPKKPSTAYFIYSNEVRAAVTKELFPEEGAKIKVAEVAAEIGKKWKALSDEDKQKYTDAAVKDKERYEQEKKEFEAGGAAAESDEDA